MRIFYVLALGHLAALLLVGFSRQTHAPNPTPHETQVLATGTGRQWFQGVKPYCNPVEAGVTLRRQPPPDNPEGWGFAAACYALAGKIEQADDLLLGVEESDRAQAAVIVFQVGHPVADAGDDDAAGPIMRLSLKHLREDWPAFYMALYHAGVSEYNMGDKVLAERHLQHFLRLYGGNDMWRTNAERVLAKIANDEGGTVFSGHGRIE